MARAETLPGEQLYPFFEVITRRSGDRYLVKICSVIFGVVFLALLGQLKVDLPFSPVVATPQIFGVLTIAFLWGKRLGTTTLIVYIIAGAAGIPVFPNGSSVITTANIGYIVAMPVAAYFAGYLADKGIANSFTGAFFIGLLSVSVIYLFGLVFLSASIPSTYLLRAGLYPFIAGAAFQIILAAGIASYMNKAIE